MYRLVGMFFTAVSVAGCAGSYESAMENKFFDTVKMPPAQSLVGVWTGGFSMGVMTLKIHSDGSGFSCVSMGANNSVYQLKHNAGSLYFQSGGYVTLHQQGDSMIATYPPMMGAQAEVKLLRDPGLENTSPYCQANIPG